MQNDKSIEQTFKIFPLKVKIYSEYRNISSYKNFVYVYLFGVEFVCLTWRTNENTNSNTVVSVSTFSGIKNTIFHIKQKMWDMYYLITNRFNS